MNGGLELPDGDRPRPEGTALGRAAGWLLGLVGLNPHGLGAFTERLVAAFRPGLEVSHPRGGRWFATLDTIDPEDNQLAVLARLSSRRPDGPREPARGGVDVEEGERELFAEPADAAADLVLTYSFPLVFTVERNLELFREFAGNELRRLRPQAAGKD